MAFATQALLDDYLGTPQNREPLDRIRDEIENYLGDNNNYAVQLGSRIIQPEQLQLLPNSLPFAVVAVTSEYQQLPLTLQQQVRLIIQADSSAQTLLDVTLPLAELNQRRITLSYIPATVADHNTVNAFGGLGSTPAYLVELRPQLKIDGHLKAVAENALPMGASHRLTLELMAPGGSTATTQTLIAGSYYAVAIGEGTDTPAAAPDPEAEPDPDDSEYLAARLLSHLAHYYNHRWRLAEQELAGLNKINLIRPLPAVVIVSNAVQLEYALGQPYALSWQGVNLDAALRLVEPISANQDSQADRDWFRLSSLQGSFL
jgi:hypothetical protein